MRAIINLSIGMVLIALGVVACGGGGSGAIAPPGGGGGSSSSSSSSSNSSGSSSSSSSVSCVATGGTNSSAAPNAAAITVDGGPTCAPPQVNVLYTTVVICAPGTTNCQTIDHVQVDTGSYGLRLLSDALDPTLAAALTTVSESQSNEPLAECIQFADGYSWGPIKTADLQIAGEKASNLEVQIIGDPAYKGAVPDACKNSGGNAENTVADFGANGILGVGPFITDCGAGQYGCAPGGTGNWYYTCPSQTPSGVSCTSSKVVLAQQMSNPVAFFAQDNNGVILQLPALAAGGQPTVQGELIFGIDTQQNNALKQGATVLYGDSITGSIATTYPATNGTTFTDGYIDSGSNAYFFEDNSIHQCPTNQGFYCPTNAPLNLSAINQGTNGTQSTVNFTIGDADSLNSANSAFDFIGGTPVTSSQQNQAPTTIFDWGLPFFFGRNVYTAIDCNGAVVNCSTTSAGYGPYFAY